MAERDMNKHQRGMVDGCFEEGHYQRGIASLNQLRMQNLRPSPAHIRQLIYISLYPPPLLKDPAKDKGKRREVSVVSGSPSKQIQQARRLQKQALFPPPEATEAAKELLHQLAIDSISPEALMRAIPCYRPTQAELDDTPRPIKSNMFFGNFEIAEDMDSYLSKQASKLKECKDCWSMLRKGVVTRQDAALVRIEDPFLDADFEDDNDESESSEAIVGRYSWHLLEWFIQLFEKDQALVIDQGRAAEDSYSILLLSQIKLSSRSGDPRSSVDSVLDVLFLCYSQTEQWRRNLGRRLMALLVSLTRCSNFSPPQLFTAIGIRLQTMPVDLVTAFLSDLPTTSLGLSVKLCICDRFLTHRLRAFIAPAADGVTRARPQARKARPVAVHADGDIGSPSRSQSFSVNQPNNAKWSLPSSRRILQLLEQTSAVRADASATLSNLIVLFHLIAAFGILRAGEGKDADSSWVDAVLGGDLERRIQDIFADTGLSDGDKKPIRLLRLLLSIKISSWKSMFT
ncbi:hypothetical protein ACEPAI_7730 [Sanghuangporus weigelae]